MEGEGSGKNLMSYLRQADATFRNGFESDEMKQIFLQNSFEEIRGEETSLCMRKVSSFIIEGMIKGANLCIVMDFFDAIKKDWVEIAGNQGGSHILEALSHRLVILLHTDEPDGDLLQRVSGLADLVTADKNLLMTLMSDTYATHALRSHIEMLGGVFFGKPSEQKDVILSKEKVPKGYVKTLKGLCKCFCKMDKKLVIGILSVAHSSPCIATLLKVLNKRNLMRTSTTLCDRILACCQFNSDEKSTFSILMKDRYSSHVIEGMVEYGHRDTRQMIQTTVLKDEDKFFELCSHPVANFVIQKLISCALDEESFEIILNTVLEGLEDILADQNYGIIQKIAEQCIKYHSFQKTFYNNLLKAFHCDTVETRKYMVILIATLTAFESFFKNAADGTTLPPTKVTIEYHGSVLLQTLLKFENVGLLIKGMCETPIDHVLSLACDASGSYFVDAFFTSSKVKFKKKRELLERLKGATPKLACSKYGSRVLENIWHASDINLKRMIAESLSSKFENLAEDQIGKFILRKFSIKQFQTRTPAWEQFQKQNINKRKLFADIVSDGAKTRRQKRRVPASFAVTGGKSE